mgnify:CR=1 FL=1
MVGVVLIIIIIAVVAAFSLQNAAPVAITFLFWRFEASLAVIVFLSALSGLVAGLLIVSLRKMSRTFSKRSRASENK